MAFEKVWTEEMDAVVKDSTLTAKEVATKLGKSESSVKNRRHVLSVKTNNAEKKKIKKESKSDTVGGRIKTLRTTANITQEELANQLGYTFRNAGCVISDYERNINKPSEEKLQILATVFNVTPDYILNGEKEEVKEVFEKQIVPKAKEMFSKHVKEIAVNVSPAVCAAASKLLKDPQPVKTAMTNEEGYVDPTAMKAIAKTMDKKPEKDKLLPKFTPHVGEIYDVLNNHHNSYCVVLSVIGDNVLMANFSVVPVTGTYAAYVNFEGKSYYINLSRLFTRKITDLITRVGSLDSTDINGIRTRIRFYFGFGKVEYSGEQDPASTVFSNSVEYFNMKNKTSFDVPKHRLSLQDALDISSSMNISLDELCKDHMADKILDEIVMYEEKIKELKAKIGLD